MATSAEAILAAARRARRSARLHVELGEAAEADELFHAIREANTILRAATAEIRRWRRPLSISGFGESHDRMLDSGDELTLTAERVFGHYPDADDEDEPDGWDRFLDDHPELESDAPHESSRPQTRIGGKIDPELVLATLSRLVASDDRPKHLRGAASTADVGKELWPDVLMAENGHPTNAQGRLAQVLRRLADEGRVVRLQARNGGSHHWTLEGLELGEHIAKGWRRDAR